MSLQALILSLVSDIDDPAVRTDVAATINYLRDVYVHGGMSEAELRQSLKEVARDVIEATKPELLPEEVEKRAEEVADQMVRAIKLETLHARAFRRFRPPLV